MGDGGLLGRHRFGRDVELERSRHQAARNPGAHALHADLAGAQQFGRGAGAADADDLGRRRHDVAVQQEVGPVLQRLDGGRVADGAGQVVVAVIGTAVLPRELHAPHVPADRNGLGAQMRLSGSEMPRAIDS